MRRLGKRRRKQLSTASGIRHCIASRLQSLCQAGKFYDSSMHTSVQHRVLVTIYSGRGEKEGLISCSYCFDRSYFKPMCLYSTNNGRRV